MGWASLTDKLLHTSYLEFVFLLSLRVMRISRSSKGVHPPPQKSAATFKHYHRVLGIKMPSSTWNVNQVLIQAPGQVLGSKAFEEGSLCGLSAESRYPHRLIHIRFRFFISM